MFERTKIRMSAAKAVDKLPLPKPDRNDLYYAIAHSSMMPAAIAGIKTDALASPSVAAAYLFAAYIDATNRQKNEGYVNHAIMAGQAAHFAMESAGATVEEAQAAIDEMVATHERSMEKLTDRLQASRGQP